MFCQGQISIQLPKDLVTERRMKAYVDSMLSANTNSKPETPTVPETGIQPCKEGLTITRIFETTSVGTKAQFHAVDAERIDFKVLNQAGAVVSSGQISPTSSVITIPYTSPASGVYTLILAGNNCTATSSKTFTISGETGSVVIPDVKPVQGLTNEVILDLTGRGFSNSTETGMEQEFAGYIEKFKYSWGWGISGVRVLVRWYDFEPTQGDYKTDALKRLIEWHRKRGLSLSIAFWPLLKGSSPMLSSTPVFQDGSKFWAVDIDNGNPAFSETAPAYADQAANERIYNAVKKISEILYTYEKVGYLALAGGATEELVWPYRENRISGFSEQNLTSFKKWCSSRGVPYAIPAVYTGGNWAWYNKDDTGKEFLRHNTFVARKYFDNFVSAVHAGNTKGRACYFMPAVVSPAHSWAQDGYVQYVAKNADEIYQSDGSNAYDLYAKTRGVNILLPTLNIPVNAEFDREDLGWNSIGFNGSTLGTEGDKVFSRGGRVVHLAMHFDDPEINSMEGSLKQLMAKWHGKAYSIPDLSGAETVDITDSFWSNQWPACSDLGKYYRTIAPTFWGVKGEPNLTQ